MYDVTYFPVLLKANLAIDKIDAAAYVTRRVVQHFINLYSPKGAYKIVCVDVMIAKRGV